MRLPLRKGLVALLVASGARAQDVTEKEFLSALAGDVPAERALEDDLARAEAAAQRSRTLANPSLEFYREAPEGNPRVTNWTLGWTPPLDGRFGLAREVADTGVAASRERLAAARVRLRTLWREAFAAWSLAVAREDVLGQQLEHTRVLAFRERERASKGEVSGLSARRFALAEAEVRAALRQTEAERARAAADARALRPDLPPEARPTLPTASTFLRTAVPARPATPGPVTPPYPGAARRAPGERAGVDREEAGRPLLGLPRAAARLANPEPTGPRPQRTDLRRALERAPPRPVAGRARGIGAARGDGGRARATHRGPRAGGDRRTPAGLPDLARVGHGGRPPPRSRVSG